MGQVMSSVINLAIYTGTPNESYAYDAVGNRTSSQRSATYSYQPFNRLTSTATASYLYNNNGNMISKTEGTSTTQFAWDFENRLTQVVTPASGSASYKYDALGRRIQRAPSTGVSTNFTYDGQDVVKDINSDGSIVEYLNGPGIDNKIRQKGSTSSTTYYFAQDHLGSTTALTGTTGKLVERITYDAYGNSAGSTKTRYGFTGRERDSLTGLQYNRARFYDPQLGRFISEDPIGFKGGDVNIYTYVGNNPANSTDPSGQWSTDAHNYIIDRALEHCLSKPQLEKLKEASRYVDRLAGQTEANAYQHGMRAPNQSIEEAKKLADAFIQGHEQKARALAPNGCKNGYQNISLEALWEIGQALHTIMDETSPAHEGFQIWYGPPYPTGIGPIDTFRYTEWYRTVLAPHEAKETLDVLKGDPGRLERVKKMVRDEFAKAFGDCGCCTG
jgi:RHS repeat-associated protein